MNVTGLIQDVEQVGGRLALVDGRLRVSRDTGPLAEELIAALRQHKAEIIAVLRDYETRQHVQEYFEERSAIREYDGELSREKAEAETKKEMPVFAREGKLMLPRCKSCSLVHWYPRLICPTCHSMDIEWFEASGEGTIHTYAVQHRAFGGWGEEVPYVTAYIDLKEGDRMMTVLRGVDPEKPEDIRIGAEVRVEFEAANEDTHIPFWRVVEA